MARHERRETRLLRARRAAKRKGAHPHVVPFSENDLLPFTDAQMHHDMSESKKHPQDAFSLCHNLPDDPASKVSFQKKHYSEMDECSFNGLSTGLRLQAEGPFTWPVA
jgi:hypothetical protein